MRSFAAIATFASLAFAGLSAALPTGIVPGFGGDGNAVGNVVGVATNVENIANNANIPILNGNAILSPTQTTGGSGPVARHDVQGLPDLIQECLDVVLPLTHELTTKITADLEVNVIVKIALDLLVQIKVILAKLVIDINALIKADLSTILYFKGQVVELSVLAQLLAQLITAVVTVLGLVVKICSSVDISALLVVIIDIAGLLAVIISLVVKVAAGLLALLIPLLACIVDIIVSLKLVALIQVLGIQV